jgi:hypothetical protein
MHHRADERRNYSAVKNYGRRAWQERRVVNSQAKMGKTDYVWAGGRVMGFEEQISREE